ncbi:hypothetical protein LTR37_018609 [Vermiconidia calcicola]|uniref:Uncharacterized protein n=1 Tax=Vermiconidia calcicola TaxID=1690605 RepID=A0ACC3MHL8_9PEZI|nr:hypothetical protein LTR37_018609 [Vermiconidia calcicola]
MANVAKNFLTGLPQRVRAVEVRSAILNINANHTISRKCLRAIQLALEALDRLLKTETRKLEAEKMELVTQMLEAAE